MSELILLAIVGGLLALEIAVVTRKLATTLVRLIAKLIPQPDRPRWEEEWLRHMQDLQGAPIMSVLWLLGLIWAAIRISVGSYGPHLLIALHEARHLTQVSRNLASSFAWIIDSEAHAMLCGREAWRCGLNHRVRAKRDLGYLRSLVRCLWWAVVTPMIVFRRNGGIDRAVERLMAIPEFGGPWGNSNEASPDVSRGRGAGAKKARTL